MSAFVKGDTKEHMLIFFPNENMKNVTSLKSIKIKFEVDINPPSGAQYDLKYKLLPSPHQVRLYDEGSLFAGKIHAILCRNWNYRTKGRDLYDYVFYLARRTPVRCSPPWRPVTCGAIRPAPGAAMNSWRSLSTRKLPPVRRQRRWAFLPAISSVWIPAHA